MKRDKVFQECVSKMESEFFAFISAQIHNLHEETIFQLLQSHGRINDYCLELAKKIKNNEETLVIHSINKQEFREALSIIDSAKDPEIKFFLTHKYGLVLCVREPSYYLQIISRQKLDETEKDKLSAILLQMPKHAMA